MRGSSLLFIGDTDIIFCGEANDTEVFESAVKSRVLFYTADKSIYIEAYSFSFYDVFVEVDGHAFISCGILSGDRYGCYS